MKSIITLTMNPAVDKNTRTDVVTSEKKLHCKRPRFDPGGGGINVSRAIKILGGKSTAFYPAGGKTGDILQSLLDKEKINHVPIPIEDSTRINVSVLEEPTGKQYRFNMPGARLNEDEWKQCLQVIYDLDSEPDFIVVSGSCPPGVPDGFYARLANLSNDICSKLIIDTSGSALKFAVDAGVFLVKSNLREFSELIQQNFLDEFQLIHKAKEIVKKCKCVSVVISLGAVGALMVDREGYCHICAPLTPVRSKVGAGDSMLAGIALSLARGKSMKEAVKFGVAAGAAAVMTSGTELCRREDTERLFQQISTVG
jgi:6-phosphofructokinase 2